MTLLHDLAALVPGFDDAEMDRFCPFYEKYAPHLGTIDRHLYRHLDDPDRQRFLTWLLRRWARIDRVNPIERALYDATLARLRLDPCRTDALNGKRYQVRDFRPQGQDFRLLTYGWVLGVHDVYYAQYEHADVGPRPGDVIIDGGGFIGDTAVLFHHRLGGRCQVHTFELLDENLALLVHNLERNGVPDDRVTVNKFALSDTTGDEIEVEGGAGVAQASASILRPSGAGEKIQTIRLDDYVRRMALDRVDYIKLDIEGAEAAALRGAAETIRLFRPRLAICLYHLWDDPIVLPQIIQATGVQYAFSFKWVQLPEGREAVLLAIPADQATHRRLPPPPREDGDAVLAAALGAMAKAHVRQRARRPERAVAAAPA